MNNQEKARVLRSAFANGLEYVGNMYRINGDKLKVEEVEALADDVEDMVDTYYSEIKSHSEWQIVQMCIHLMQELVSDFQEWYEFVHGDVRELPEDNRFCVNKTYFRIVRWLLLHHTSHSGGTSTIKKCKELGIDDWSKSIEFSFEVDDE